MYRDSADIKLTGIGVSILPGSDVEVEITFKDKSSKHHVVNKTAEDKVSVILEEPIETSLYTNFITLSISGTGFGRVGKVESHTKEIQLYDIYRKILKKVELSNIRNPEGPLLIAELYFSL